MHFDVAGGLMGLILDTSVFRLDHHQGNRARTVFAFVVGLAPDPQVLGAFGHTVAARMIHLGFAGVLQCGRRLCHRVAVLCCCRPWDANVIPPRSSHRESGLGASSDHYALCEVSLKFRPQPQHA